MNLQKNLLMHTIHEYQSTSKSPLNERTQDHENRRNNRRIQPLPLGARLSDSPHASTRLYPHLRRYERKRRPVGGKLKNLWRKHYMPLQYTKKAFAINQYF